MRHAVTACNGSHGRRARYYRLMGAGSPALPPDRVRARAGGGKHKKTLAELSTRVFGSGHPPKPSGRSVLLLDALHQVVRSPGQGQTLPFSHKSIKKGLALNSPPSPDRVNTLIKQNLPGVISRTTEYYVRLIQ